MVDISYRGEKLIVSKDSRQKKSGCPKYFCGSFGAVLLVGAIAVAVLVGGEELSSYLG